MRFFNLMPALAVVASSFKDAETRVETEATESALAPGGKGLYNLKNDASFAAKALPLIDSLNCWKMR